MKENIFWIVFVAYILWSYYKNNRFNSQIESLKQANKDLTKQVQDLTKKSRAGNFFVRLEKVDEGKRDLLTMVIAIITELEQYKAKNFVDVVRLGSMSIIVDNISEDYANEVRQTIENHGGTAVVIKKS